MLVHTSMIKHVWLPHVYRLLSGTVAAASHQHPLAQSSVSTGSPGENH